jgi:hypothetical protein
MGLTERIARAKDLVWTKGHRAAHDEVRYFGCQPIGNLEGREAVESEVLRPLERALPNLRIEPYVFLGGEWNGEIWVAATGEVIAEMHEPWLGIPARTTTMRLRFGTFHQVLDDCIVETRELFDIIGFASQVGIELLPPSAGRTMQPPGPALGNGLSRNSQPAAATQKTRALVDAMLDGCNDLDGSNLESMGMGRFWHDDMAWYGPWGVGSTLGFDEFQRDAQGPSVASFPNRRGGFHQARIADGLTAAFTGWPSLQGTFDGVAFRGIEPTGGPIGQNIMDFYLRRGPKLHENWVLIDLIDFAAQCGVDLLAQLPIDGPT